MKNKFGKITWCVLAFSAVLAFTNCQSLDMFFREPTVSLRSVQLAGISFTGAQLLCKVNVENPNGFDIPFPEVGWEFYINTHSFSSGVLKNNEPIRSRRTTPVEILVNVEYVEIFSAITSLIGSKSFDYKIALDTKFSFAELLSTQIISTEILNRVWHFEHEGTIPILQIPAVTFRGIEVKNTNLIGLISSLDFELTLEIENKNIFAMMLNNLSYNFAVNNSQWSNGSVRNINIAADGKAVVPISFSLNSLSMVAEIIRIITGNTDVSYRFTGDMRLGVDLPIISDLARNIELSGTTRLRR